MNDYTILENLFKDKQDEIHFDLFKESNVIKINNDNGDNNNFDNGIPFNTQSIASKMINYKDAYVLLRIECEIPFDETDQGKKSIPKLLYLKNSFEISGKGDSKNRNFFEVKSKYPSLFERKNYPLSNISINNLLKNEKHFDKCYSKDQIPLIENNKSLIFNLENSDQSGSHWVGLSRKNNNIFIFDSFGIGYVPNNLYKIYKNYNIITNIYRIQDINSNLRGMFCIIFCLLYKVDSKNKFISFLNLFNSNNFLKNELI